MSFYRRERVARIRKCISDKRAFLLLEAVQVGRKTQTVSHNLDYTDVGFSFLRSARLKEKLGGFSGFDW